MQDVIDFTTFTGKLSARARRLPLTRTGARRQAPPMLKGSGTRKLGGRDSLRAFQRFLGWSLVALFVSLFPSRAHAYTWMIKHGYASCPVCHADPSGGELLTSYGRVQSDELLRMKYGKGASESSRVAPKAPRLVRSLELKTDALSGPNDADPSAKPEVAP